MPVDISTITRYLDLCGIKSHHKGYKYLQSAITSLLERTDKKLSMQILYSETAELYNTQSGAVERLIRYALQDINMSNKAFLFRAIDDIKKNRVPVSASAKKAAVSE